MVGGNNYLADSFSSATFKRPLAQVTAPEPNHDDQNPAPPHQLAVIPPFGDADTVPAQNAAPPQPLAEIPSFRAGDMIPAQHPQASPSASQARDDAGIDVNDDGDPHGSLTTPAQRASPPFPFPFRVLEKCDADKTNAVFTPDDQSFETGTDMGALHTIM